MRKPSEITINGKALDVILNEHKHWLNEDIDGWENMRADLHGANLHHTDLKHADLRDAILRHIDLSDASLYGANLHHADLSGADLHDANLCNTNLNGAILYNADLSGADLHYANLCSTNLNCANLCDANLYRANLYDAIFHRAKGTLIEYRKGKILSEAITGYKKCENNVLVTLEIPRGAIVFSINGYKCRTNKAKVIAIDGTDRAYSIYTYMSYYVGDEFTIYDFNCQYNEECGAGIHFFMAREEAKDY